CHHADPARVSATRAQAASRCWHRLRDPARGLRAQHASDCQSSVHGPRRELRCARAQGPRTARNGSVPARVYLTGWTSWAIGGFKSVRVFRVRELAEQSLAVISGPLRVAHACFDVVPQFERSGSRLAQCVETLQEGPCTERVLPLVKQVGELEECLAVVGISRDGVTKIRFGPDFVAGTQLANAGIGQGNGGGGIERIGDGLAEIGFTFGILAGRTQELAEIVVRITLVRLELDRLAVVDFGVCRSPDAFVDVG